MKGISILLRRPALLPSLRPAGALRSNEIARLLNFEITSPVGSSTRLIAELPPGQLVLAASSWTKKSALKSGIGLPLFAVEQKALATDAVPELLSRNGEVPAFRDPTALCDNRPEGNSRFVGIYGREPRFCGTDGIPPNFGQEFSPLDPDRLEDRIQPEIERVPEPGQSASNSIIYGPICFTPDRCALVAPSDGAYGLWLAAGFRAVVGAGVGSGQFLASWNISGNPPNSQPAIYPSRFRSTLDKVECLRRINSVYFGSCAEGTHRGLKW